MKVLLSIKPEFVNKIFSGEKQYEYRKNLFRRKGVNTIVIYATMPVGKIVGEFSVDGVLEGVPAEIWKETKNESGLSWSFFSKYFSGRDRGYAIRIGSLKKYGKGVNPYHYMENFKAPQSFRYLPDQLAWEA